MKLGSQVSKGVMKQRPVGCHCYHQWPGRSGKQGTSACDDDRIHDGGQWSRAFQGPRVMEASQVLLDLYN